MFNSSTPSPLFIYLFIYYVINYTSSNQISLHHATGSSMFLLGREDGIVKDILYTWSAPNILLLLHLLNYFVQILKILHTQKTGPTPHYFQFPWTWIKTFTSRRVIIRFSSLRQSKATVFNSSWIPSLSWWWVTKTIQRWKQAGFI